MTDFVIVTGLSGAGKSRTMEVLEDIGFYCVDNMPPTLISNFAEICDSSTSKIERVAVVTDVRGGQLFNGLFNEFKELDDKGIKYKLLFLDADDRILMRRFKETRRVHPLLNLNDCSTLTAINIERKMLLTAKNRADYIIDTSMFSDSQLKARIREIFLNDVACGMLVNCMSFGFKYGFPKESDLMFDIRCLPNPYYVDELREKTGLDNSVQDYVMSNQNSATLYNKLLDLLDFLIPLYVSEGKTQLTIAIGCTGGKHRSVTFTEKLFKHLKESKIKITIYHRDIYRFK